MDRPSFSRLELRVMLGIVVALIGFCVWMTVARAQAPEPADDGWGRVLSLLQDLIAAVITLAIAGVGYLSWRFFSGKKAATSAAVEADELRKFKVARNESLDERNQIALEAIQMLAKERAETTGNIDLRKLVEKIDEVAAKKPPADPKGGPP